MNAERKGLTVDKQQKNLVAMQIAKGLTVGEQQKNQSIKERCVMLRHYLLSFLF